MTNNDAIAYINGLIENAAPVVNGPVTHVYESTATVSSCTAKLLVERLTDSGMFPRRKEIVTRDGEGVRFTNYDEDEVVRILANGKIFYYRGGDF